jgi:hypothetical protein
MRIYLTAIVLLFISLNQLFAQIDSAEASYYKAYNILTTLDNKYSQVILNAKITGYEYIGGHLSIPYYLDTCKLVGNISDSNKGIVEKFNILFRDKSYTSETTFKNDSCFFTDYGENNISKSLISERAMTYFYNPYNIITYALKNINTIHCLSSASEIIIGFNDNGGYKYYVFLNKENLATNKIEKLTYNKILGDTKEEIDFYGYKKINGIYVPDSLEHKRAGNAYRSFSFNYKKEPYSIKKEILSTSISVDTLAENTYLLKMDNFNNKVLTYIEDDGVYVFDAPIGLTVSRMLVNFINKNFPNKSTKICFISHHHPDHAGGIAAFVENGFRIISTKGNVNYFQDILSRKHTRNYPDSIYNAHNNIQIDTIPLSMYKTIKTEHNNIVAYECGYDTHHTKEFLIFYLEKQRILFVADLIQAKNGSALVKSDRVTCVYNIIHKYNLNVDKIVSSWPLNGYKDYISIKKIKKCIQ